MDFFSHEAVSIPTTSTNKIQVIRRQSLTGLLDIDITTYHSQCDDAVTITATVDVVSKICAILNTYTYGLRKVASQPQYTLNTHLRVVLELLLSSHVRIVSVVGHRVCKNTAATRYEG